MTASTPACQLLQRQNKDYCNWLWVAPPADPWLADQPGPVWTTELGVARGWRERGATVFDDLAPAIPEVPGAVLFWPKALALGEWWLLALCAQLPRGTRLQVVGENQGGIRRLLKILAALGLGCRRLDNARRCMLFETRVDRLELAPEAAWSRFEALGLELVSHPGVFGHGKLDEGTRLLLESLPEPAELTGKRVLDVGCGNGVIAAWLASRGARVTALDSSAFAVEAARRSLAANGLSGEVRQSDVYSALAEDEHFDAIVSNPPFHQERTIDYDPATRLIREAPAHLAKGGNLTLVANAFLPYPDRLEAAFGDFETLADDRRFRVYRALRH